MKVPRNADEFAFIFDQRVRQPLENAGFKSRGKSLYLIEDDRCLSLIRLGGRMAHAGSISHILCFRHQFLRTLEKTVVKGFISEPFSYPYKLHFRDFAGADEPCYKPQIWNYEWDEIAFSEMSMAKLIKSLDALRQTMVESVVPWSRNLTPMKAKEEIKDLGKDSWIERLWIRDYVKQASAHSTKNEIFRPAT